MGRNVIEVIIKAQDQASGKLQLAGKSVDGFNSKLKIIGAVAAAAAAALAYSSIRIIKSTAAWGDNIAKTAKRIGTTTEFLSEMGHAAEIAGASSDQLHMGLRRMARSASDASFGLMTQKRAFDELGITVKDVDGRLKDVETIFMESAEALSKMDDATRKAAIAQEIFGRGGDAMLVLLDEGAEGIGKMRLEARRLGITLSGEGARRMEEFADSITRIKTAMKGLAVQFVAEEAGDWAKFIDGVTGSIIEMKKVMESKEKSWWEKYWDIGNVKDRQKAYKDEQERLEQLAEANKYLRDMQDVMEVKPPVPPRIFTPTWETYEEEDPWFVGPPAREAMEKAEQIQLRLMQNQAQINALLREGYQWSEQIGTWTLPTPEKLMTQQYPPAPGELMAQAWAKPLPFPEFEEMPEKFHMALDEMDRDASQFAGSIGGAFSGMFMSIVNGAEDMADAMKNILLSLIGSLLNAGVVGWLGKVLPFGGGGEWVPHAQSGLEVIGGQYHRDTVPAVVSRGEVVMPSPTVERLNRFLSGNSGGARPTVNLNPLFMTGSRHEAYRAAGFIEEKLAMHSGYVVTGVI